MSPSSQGFRVWGLMALMMLLVACASSPPPQPASLRVITKPYPAMVTIAGFKLESGEYINLASGVYDLVIELENYRRHTEQIVLDEGMTMDRVITLDPINAELTLEAQPANAELRIGDRIFTSGQTVALRPDHYEIEASRDGYFSEIIRLQLNPGEQQTVNIDLQRIPKSGELSLSAHHPDARIFLDENDLGVGAVTMSKDFGSYRFESILELADWRRERTEQRIDFRRGGQQQFLAGDAELEYFYEDRWLPSEQALELEEADYLAMQVAEPIYLQTTLTEDLATSLREREDLQTWLFGLLRPGDRLALSFGEDKVLLWARAQQLDSAFVEGVSAFRIGSSYSPPWRVPETDITPMQVILDETPDLAFALLAARPFSPLVSLDRLALASCTDDQITLTRVAADGELRLLIEGGEALMLDGEELAADDYGLIDQIIPAATANHQLDWQSVPERLLLVPSMGPFAVAPKEVELMRGEKQVVSIGLPIRPASVRQWTVRNGNDDEEGVWEILEWSLAPGAAPDLREVDFGPHSRAGVYRRTWIFEYPNGDSNTQRQVDAEYTVGEQEAETQSGLFLRRKPSPSDSN